MNAKPNLTFSNGSTNCQQEGASQQLNVENVIINFGMGMYICVHDLQFMLSYIGNKYNASSTDRLTVTFVSVSTDYCTPWQRPSTFNSILEIGMQAC